MLEWSKRKGDQLYNIFEFYEREAVKVTQQLYELIQSSDGLLEFPINWRDMVMLRTPFLRLL